ncbi:P2X purinoceptor 3-like [Hemiscyllium ocellatum]|uniref:P2X purinoceptor 3-like n=1 Tax=Hemiscyllium ocellatum TaxID=170820 RepID=UPI0029677132|nr:P2X purinoceptor 3-like [Hemiscyllium ocellatum]
MGFIEDFFTYETPKSVVVKSWTVGIINRVMQLLIITYFIGWVFIHEKAYQTKETQIESTVITKVKGFGRTQLPNGLEKVMDVVEYVIPPQGGAVFSIITSTRITENQVQGTCPEGQLAESLTLTGHSQTALTQTGHFQTALTMTGHSQTALTQTGHSQTSYSQTALTMTGPSQTALTETGHSQTALTMTGPSQTALTETGHSQTALTQTGHSQTTLPQTGPSQTTLTQTGHSQTTLTQTGHSQTALTLTGLFQTTLTLTSHSQTALTPTGYSKTTMTLTNHSQTTLAQTVLTQTSHSQTVLTQTGHFQTTLTQTGYSQTDPDNKEFLCQTDDQCDDQVTHQIGSGIRTGRCVRFQGSVWTCEIRGWCPVELDDADKALMTGAENFTIFIKNSIRFPLFNFSKGNMLPNITKDYMRSCSYHPETDLFCPIFRLRDVVRLASQDFSTLTRKGGVIGIRIEWKCNLDLSAERCVPRYSFLRLDRVSQTNNISQGYNFRHARFYRDSNGTDYRTLLKAYGIRIDIMVTGQAAKFDIIPTVINMVAAFTSIGLGAVVCDLILLNFVKGADKYKARKFEEVGKDYGKHSKDSLSCDDLYKSKQTLSLSPVSTNPSNSPCK